jgi:hypothetical protein
MPEGFVNNFSTTVAAGIGAGVTTVTVAAAVPNATADLTYRGVHRASAEIFQITAGADTTTWTIVRAAEDAARYPAAAWSLGDTLDLVLTADGADARFLNHDGDELDGQYSMAEGTTLRDQFGYRFNQRETYRLAMGWNNGAEPGSTPRAKGFTASDFEYVDLTALNAGWEGFQLAIHAGRWIIYLPYGGSTLAGGVAQGNFCFYDITKPFGEAASYTDVDLRTLLTEARGEGFLGACVDPKPDNPYVYFCSNHSDSTGSSTANWKFFRWNYTMEPDDAAAWDVFDLSTASGTGAPPTAGNAYATCCTDGRYIYYCPVGNPATAVTHGEFLRHDTKGALGGYDTAFENPANWSVFDLTTVNAGLVGFQSIGFDGQYVYLAPFKTDLGDTGLFCRYNTNADFFTAGSYDDDPAGQPDPRCGVHRGLHRRSLRGADPVGWRCRHLDPAQHGRPLRQPSGIQPSIQLPDLRPSHGGE